MGIPTEATFDGMACVMSIPGNNILSKIKKKKLRLNCLVVRVVFCVSYLDSTGK